MRRRAEYNKKSEEYTGGGRAQVLRMPAPAVAWGLTQAQLEGLVAEQVSLSIAKGKRGIPAPPPTRIWVTGLGWRGGGHTPADAILAAAFVKWLPLLDRVFRALEWHRTRLRGAVNEVRPFCPPRLAAAA